MGRGRAPCCDRSKVKKGPWSPAEDLRLTTFIQNHGHSNWRALPKEAGLLRCGKSCRLRWINYLRPDVKRGNFTPQEELTIIDLHNSIGNKWSKIASYLPGRTDNEIKNVWNTHLKKRSLMTNKSTTHDSHDQSQPNGSKPNYSSASPSCTSSSITSSSGDDQNTGKPNSDQEIQESEIKKPNKDSTISANSSSTSSHASNFDEKSEFSKSDEVVINTDIHELDIGKIEIPLESDIDFWELFDSLDKNQESNIPNPEEKIEGDQIEWFRLLENELGLTCDADPLAKDQNIVTTTDLEMHLEPKISPGLDYFPIWPSSPQNLGI